MARTKKQPKDEKPARRQGSAAHVKPEAKGPARARKAGEQLAHPVIGDGTVAELEAVGRKMKGCRDQRKAEDLQLATLKIEGAKLLEDRDLPFYDTKAGVRITRKVKVDVTVTNTPKSAKKKSRKGQPVPGVS